MQIRHTLLGLFFYFVNEEVLKLPSCASSAFNCIVAETDIDCLVVPFGEVHIAGVVECPAVGLGETDGGLFVEHIPRQHSPSGGRNVACIIGRYEYRHLLSAGFERVGTVVDGLIELQRGLLGVLQEIWLCYQ